MGVWDGIKNIFNLSDEDYEDDMLEEEENEDEADFEQEPVSRKVKEPARKEPSRFGERRSAKTVPFNNGDNMRLYLAKPERFEDVTAIADQYCARRTVVLNLEKTDRDLARRILDFMSGVAYAKNGDLRKAAINTFVIVPSDVDVSGENAVEDFDDSKFY